MLIIPQSSRFNEIGLAPAMRLRSFEPELRTFTESPWHEGREGVTLQCQTAQERVERLLARVAAQVLDAASNIMKGNGI